MGLFYMFVLSTLFSPVIFTSSFAYKEMLNTDLEIFEDFIKWRSKNSSPHKCFILGEQRYNTRATGECIAPPAPPSFQETEQQEQHILLPTELHRDPSIPLFWTGEKGPSVSFFTAPSPAAQQSARYHLIYICDSPNQAIRTQKGLFLCWKSLD